MDTFMRGLLATAQVLAVAGCSGTVLVFSWCALIILQRALDRPPAQEPEPVPVLSPDLVPPDTTVDAANGVTYTVAEIQAISSQFTADEWKQLVQVAARHHAPPKPPAAVDEGKAEE